MSRRILFKTRQIHFPPDCVVCQAPASAEHSVTRTINYANRNIPVSIKVPMCAAHFRAASEKGPREQMINRVGMSAGIITGGLSLFGLLRLWSASDQGVPVLNLFVAGFVGVSLFMLLWSVTNYFLAPLLAGPEVVAARHALRILRYWPRSDQIQLEFENESAADAVAEANRDQVLVIH